MKAPLRIFVLAGEPSGDRLGAALMRRLREETDGAVSFIGVGGDAMCAEGLEPVFPMADISVMGLAEVVPHIPRVLRRLREARDAVIAARPDAVVTIDAQVFSAMLAKRVRRALPDAVLVQYVAPTVWAWKPWRAAKAAKIYDRMLTLFPFEPAYFEEAGLAAECVGHPLVERLASLPEAAPHELRLRLGIAADAPLLLIAPGSRAGEIAKLVEPFGEALALLKAQVPALEAVLPVAPSVADAVLSQVDNWPVKPHLLRFEGLDFEAGEAQKFAAFAAADAALAASGTVTLELAGTRTPVVVGYKLPKLTEAMLRVMVKVKTGSLVNIILGRNAIPELFQERCNGPDLAAALLPLVTGGKAAQAQRAACDEAFAALGQTNAPPSVKAARAVLSAIADKRQRLVTST